MSHPIDTIKTRLQTTNKYRGILDCFAKMRQTEGLRSFYKGMSFPFYSVAAANFLAFGAYGNMLRFAYAKTYVDVRNKVQVSRS